MLGLQGSLYRKRTFCGSGSTDDNMSAVGLHMREDRVTTFLMRILSSWLIICLPERGRLIQFLSALARRLRSHMPPFMAGSAVASSFSTTSLFESTAPDWIRRRRTKALRDLTESTRRMFSSFSKRRRAACILRWTRYAHCTFAGCLPRQYKAVSASSIASWQPKSCKCVKANDSAAMPCEPIAGWNWRWPPRDHHR